VARWELLELLAVLLDRLHLGREADRPIATPAPVERDHADRIACRHEGAVLLVQDDEGEDSVKAVNLRASKRSVRSIAT
jgi:hypothetical protein